MAAGSGSGGVGSKVAAVGRFMAWMVKSVVLSPWRLVIRPLYGMLRRKTDEPRLMLEEAVDTMASEHHRAKEAVAQAVVDETKLTRQRDTLRVEAEKWREIAGRKVKSGDDAGARSALLSQKATAERLQATEKLLERHQDQVRALKRTVEEMGRKVEQARLRKGELIARMEVARAQGGGEGEDSKPDPFAEFRRIEDTIEEAAMRAEVLQDLDGSATARELERLEASSSAEDEADAELARLKAEMAGRLTEG